MRPKLHLFVCANRREGSPLGPGCGDAGAEVFARLKELVAERRAFSTIWVTETKCLGLCPKSGCTVASYPEQRIIAGIETADAESLLAPATERTLEAELVAMEELQTEKVLDLARRLKPGITLEDVKNPHDFPELADPDWHYEDGVLTGIQGALACLRSRAARSRD